MCPPCVPPDFAICPLLFIYSRRNTVRLLSAQCCWDKRGVLTGSKTARTVPCPGVHCGVKNTNTAFPPAKGCVGQCEVMCPCSAVSILRASAEGRATAASARCDDVSQKYRAPASTGFLILRCRSKSPNARSNVSRAAQPVEELHSTACVHEDVDAV